MAVHSGALGDVGARWDLDELTITLTANPPPTIGESNGVLIVAVCGQSPPTNLTVVMTPAAENQLIMCRVILLADVRRSRAGGLNECISTNPPLAAPLLAATICNCLLDVSTLPCASVNRDRGILSHGCEAA